jgi:hypothetical protein
MSSEDRHIKLNPFEIPQALLGGSHTPEAISVA